MAARTSTARSTASVPYYKTAIFWIAVVAGLALIGHFGGPADSSANVPEITVAPPQVTVEAPPTASQDGFCSGSNNVIIIGDVPANVTIPLFPAPASAPAVTDCEEMRRQYEVKKAAIYASIRQ